MPTEGSLKRYRGEKWSKRYFKTDGVKCKIVWFKKKKSEKKVGALKLAGCTLSSAPVAGEETSFTVVSPDGLNDLSLLAKSAEEKMKWIDALQLIISATE
tara:strand:+ start:1131 stop:1430 length:300 start_codon:yes stop_codon:yes gene_type:complete